MTVYITATLLSIVLAFCYRIHHERTKVADAIFYRESKYIKKRTSKMSKVIDVILKVLSAMPLIIVAGLRRGVGRDYFTAYVDSYLNNMYGINGYYASEYVYNLIETSLAKIQADYIWLFLICAIVFGFCYYKSIFDYSVSPEYSIVLLIITNIYFIFLNGMRQGLAMSIFFFSIRYIQKRKFKSFAICMIIAIGVHTSSVLFIPLYFLYNVRWDVFRTILLLIAGVAGGGVFGKLLQVVILYSPYSGYYNSMFADDGFELIYALIQTSVLIVLSLYYKNAMKSEYANQYQFFYWMQVLAVFFCYESGILPLAKRLCWSMSINQLISLPLLNKLEPSRLVRVFLTTAIIVFFSISIYVGIVVNGAHHVLPYHWFFETNFSTYD